jgi:hypothetical protein
MIMKRKGSDLSKSLDGRLKTYSLVAMAAGASALALAQPAEAEVVVTKTNTQITFGSSASFDLNGDGVADFTLSNNGVGYDHSFYGSFFAIPLTGGKVVAGTRGPQGAYASALINGAVVGPSAHFSSSAGRGQAIVERSTGNASSFTTYKYFGNWGNLTDRFLGVRFLIDGETHYGWIRITTGWKGRIQATVTAYAYETVANKKITINYTGEGVAQDADSPDAVSHAEAITLPNRRGPSLGMLAQGADGLAHWRSGQ